jgi:hypothetical protein
VTAIKLPHRGLGRGTVAVPRAVGGTALVVEIKGFLLFGDVRGVIDTPDRLEQGRDLCSVWITNRQPVRGIVPPQYTHVRVEPTTSPRSRNGLHWWRLGFRPADTCARFAGEVGGKHDDVFQYHGQPTSCRLQVADGALYITHSSFDGRRQESLMMAKGPYRGRFDLPGPGLIQIKTDTTWSATVEPQ